MKDSLVTFYPNGSTEERILRLPKELFIQEYDSLSRLREVSYNSTKSFFLTDYKKTEFFTNGKIKREESNIHRLVRIKRVLSQWES